MIKYLLLLVLFLSVGCSTNEYQIIADNQTNSKVVATLRVNDGSDEIITVQSGVLAPKTRKNLTFKAQTSFTIYATIIDLEIASPEHWRNVCKEFDTDHGIFVLSIKQDTLDLGLPLLLQR